MRYAKWWIGGLLALGLTWVPARADEFERLYSGDVPTMVAASNALCKLEERAIPELIHLLDTSRTIEPTSEVGASGSVMYPGHGGTACFRSVFYGLNDSRVRVGWVLERITFQDFGFSSIHAFHCRTDEELDRAVDRARSWWASKGSGWSSLDGLEEALKSGSVEAQRRALYYLRNSTRDCFCRELDEASYFARLHALVEDLLGSPEQGIREAAAEVWVGAEWNRTDGGRRLILDQKNPSLQEDRVFRIQGADLMLGDRVFVKLGDELGDAGKPVSLFDFGWSSGLKTFPGVLAHTVDGKVVSWEVLGSSTVPWGPSNYYW